MVQPSENYPDTFYREATFLPLAMNLPLDVSTNAPTEVNDKGGKQSKTDAAYELLPPIALTLVARILLHGYKKYGAWNWRDISSQDSLRHTIGHLMAAISQDDTDQLLPDSSPYVNHLAKAATRALFTLETAYLEEYPDAQYAIDRRGAGSRPL